MSTLAVYPGSFDPLTNGHVDIISRGARLFDRIVVAILVNAEKSPLFTMQERVDIARAVFRDHGNVEVDTFDGLLVDYVARRGAQVIAIASAHNVDFVRDLGADEVIDRGTTPFETAVRDVDVVLDTVSGETLEKSWSVLRPRDGLLITLLDPPSPQWAAGRPARGLFFIVEPSRPQLNELSRLFDAGTLRPIVEAVLPLREARQAYERGIRDHPRGKLVLAVGGG